VGTHSELSRAPNSAVVDPETVKSNILLRNTWKPDGEHCHMQTLTVKLDDDVEKSDVKVYWNKMSPPGAFNLTSILFDHVLIVHPGSEFVDNIMMSSSFWNLPRPGLIISVTGSADEFVEENELIAHDQPYVLFQVPLQHLAPKMFVHVPVRKAGCMCDSTRKEDSLSDVLHRIADYMSHSSDDFRERGQFVAELANCLQEPLKLTPQEPHKHNITFEVICNGELSSPDKTLSFSFVAELANCLQEPLKLTPQEPHKLNITFEVVCNGEMSSPDRNFEKSKNEKSKQELLTLFQKFMQDLNDFRFVSYVKVGFESTGISEESLADVSAGKCFQMRTLKIHSLIEDDDIFEDTNKNKDNDFLEVNLFHFGSTRDKFCEEKYHDKYEDLQRRIENLSLGQFPSICEHEKPGLADLELMKNKLTLPQPIWRNSTVILYHDNHGDKAEVKKLFSRGDFQKFQKDREFQNDKTFFLLRTQGTGCNLTSAVIERILHQVVFLLPLQFGSVWIITGGSNKGIMKVFSAIIDNLFTMR
jgi:hypothetical protein